MTIYDKLAELKEDFRIQLQVIYALMMREIHTRYGRENLGFLWVLGEPILFCAGVAILWTAIRPSHEHGLPMTAIVVTGYVPLTMWRHCLGHSVKAFEANGSLLFHRQVTPTCIIIARASLEIIGTTMAGVLVTCAAIFAGFMKPPQYYGMLYLGLGFQMVFCLAIAMIFASLSEMSNLVEKAVGILSYLSLPFTGAFTMVNWLPPKYRWYMMISPSVDNIEMIREGEFGLNAHAHYDIFYDFWITLLLLILGFYSAQRVRRFILVQ
ncbi:ABC transporter permease [Komagataeibacter diospyri]|uniref:Capsular polysaccharide ABC transporter transmembrane protein n=1 Tax=Komagataeibacter diospyri TaxID=1932662 RepID=A0A4P5P0I5_9PROT|nr:ABC transporter permease [Komagataeibacter diospyri]GCE83789.1 capsular polysaccharide ABC transporter transmembrane protein [Komagataeibacter diospyri]GCE90693.1 capsular polysaccharide ABC transporter transmembrane protein [Komagataeibacter diospyri]